MASSLLLAAASAGGRFAMAARTSAAARGTASAVSLRAPASLLPVFVLGDGGRSLSAAAAGTAADTDNTITALLEELRTLDTACLCDADTKLKLFPPSKEWAKAYGDGLRLLDPSIQPVNDPLPPRHVMAGVARTVQLTQRNDFLAVLRGIVEAQRDEVLVVHSLQSDRAVAGELFAAEALRKGVAGIVVVDGAMRDANALRTAPLDQVRCYATSISPSAGTMQSIGRQQEIVGGGGRGVVEVCPGDVVVGDGDGIVVGSAAAFRGCLAKARDIQQTEGRMVDAMLAGGDDGKELASLNNFHEHLQKRLEGKESNLEFRMK